MSGKRKRKDDESDHSKPKKAPEKKKGHRKESTSQQQQQEQSTSRQQEPSTSVQHEHPLSKKEQRHYKRKLAEEQAQQQKPPALRQHEKQQQQTPPTPEQQQTPPTPQHQQTPPTPEQQQTPPTPQQQQTPPTPEQQQTPPTPQQQQTPPTPEQQQTPPTQQQQRSPHNPGRQQTPPTQQQQRSPHNPGRQQTPPTQQQQRSPHNPGRQQTPPTQQQQRSPHNPGRQQTPPPQQQQRSPHTQQQQQTPPTQQQQQTPPTQQQQRSPHNPGRQQTPPPQQQQRSPHNPGRQQTPPTQQQQRSPHNPGRQQTPPTQQQQRSPHNPGRQQTPPPQQQQRSPHTQQQQQTPPTQQQQRSPHNPGRQQTPPPQQQQRSPHNPGRQQTPPTQQQQRSPHNPGRQQTPPTQQQQRSPHNPGRQQTPPPQQQQRSPHNPGRQQTPPTQQQQRSPHNPGRQQTPPPQQQQRSPHTPEQQQAPPTPEQQQAPPTPQQRLGLQEVQLSPQHYLQVGPQQYLQVGPQQYLQLSPQRYLQLGSQQYSPPHLQVGPELSYTSLAIAQQQQQALQIQEQQQQQALQIQQQQQQEALQIQQHQLMQQQLQYIAHQQEQGSQFVQQPIPYMSHPWQLQGPRILQQPQLDISHTAQSSQQHIPSVVQPAQLHFESSPIHYQQQYGPPTTQQQQQQRSPPKPQQQQQRSPPKPQQQQQRSPPKPQQQQQRTPPKPQQQQQRTPPKPQQQQQRTPPTPQQQQQRTPPKPQQQQQRTPPKPQQQQQRTPPKPQQQQQRTPPKPQQQQQRTPPKPQQQQQRTPPKPQQQQQRTPPTPQQQQQRTPPKPQQQQQRTPPKPQQQMLQDPSVYYQQQQQRPSTSQQHWQYQESHIPIQHQQEQQGEQLTSESPQTEEMKHIKGRGDRERCTLSSEMQKMYIDQIPSRCTTGQSGRKITVETNMFRLLFKPTFETCIVHYDVVFNPDKPKFLLRSAFEQYRNKHFTNRYPAFDGNKNAYSAKELPFGDQSEEDEVTVFDVGGQRNHTFKVHLKKAAVLDLTWLKDMKYDSISIQSQQKYIQALDIILRHGTERNAVPVGRSFFYEPQPGRVVSLTNGLDMWVGVFQSAVIGWKPYLNVDVAHKGFPTPKPIIDLLKDLCKRKKTDEPLQTITEYDIKRNAEKINRFLKGLKIQYEIPEQPNSKRTYRVNELGASARNYKFETDNGELWSVEKYFAQQKRCTLKQAELPCLWVGSRNNDRKIYLPMELCTIVAGQVIQKKMDESQTSALIKQAATDTRKRKEKIMNGLQQININEQPTLMKEFNLSVLPEFEKISARVLEAPKLKYARQEPVCVTKGVWQAEKFLHPSSLKDNEWTILNLDAKTSIRELQNGFCKRFQECAAKVNMSLGKMLFPICDLSRSSKINDEVLNFLARKKNQGIRLVMVVIPNIYAYSLVKKSSELIIGGIVTQCIKLRTIENLTDTTITNILLKINSKLNGINHLFYQRPRCLDTPSMLVGADVTHPSPDAKNTPSIAAVVSSQSNTFQYDVELRLQPPKEEIILDLENIMLKQLELYHTNVGEIPDKIIFYRDGVGEGHFPQVMHREISAIKRAISKLGNGTYKIPITFLVVQKRHHIRLFPTNKANSDDRNFNVQAGTIVDTDITHPRHIDFYLVSHASIQGTARPTKYRCICNEIGMTEDEIEQLTYYLCHLFARCTRSVSYPAPTYYAHLAAYRARAWIHNEHINLDDLQEEERKKLTPKMKNSPMFFV